MTPAKGEGSSFRKGKEITANDLATKTIGEDAPLFGSEHSEEEEAGRDPDSKCALLINPWHDTYMHFPVVPDDYLPPPSGRMWLSICRHGMEVS